ncbi:glycosyltransferase family 25 protein [Pseudidiomarina halophila]|uniref:glycosyltransferase family 25 protein n=1 Tax=Pseudidiomarina halophila TaxID=1449799 RepID=UPI00361A5C91
MADTMKWKVLVINLERSPQRWHAMVEQLEASGLPYERVEAVAGDTLTAEQIAQVFDSKAARHNYHYQLSRGEIGCYLSHLKAWQTILNQQLDYAIVLEDDVVLDAKFRLLPKVIVQCDEAWDLIKIAAPFKQQKSYVLNQLDGFRSVRFKNRLWEHVVTLSVPPALLSYWRNGLRFFARWMLICSGRQNWV